MALQFQTQQCNIASNQSCSSPVRIRGATTVALVSPGLHASSAQTLTIQGATVAQADGAGYSAATSAQFVNVQKPDGSGALQFVLAGGFAISLAAQIHGLDEIRFVVSSLLSSDQKSLCLFVKV